MSISRKELYSGSMVIFVALYYLILVGSLILQVSDDRFQWMNLKMLLLALFYLASGVLLLLRKKVGWVMSAGVLLNFVMLSIVILLRMSQETLLNGFAVLGIFIVMLLVLAFVFLFGKQTRRKFAVNNKSYLATIGIYLLLIAANFLI